MDGALRQWTMKIVSSLSIALMKSPQEFIRCFFCSSLNLWGTNVAQSFRLPKSYINIFRTNWRERFNSFAIIRTDKRRSCSNNFLTLSTFAVVLLVNVNNIQKEGEVIFKIKTLKENILMDCFGYFSKFFRGK